jgi:hypothetical protein
MKQIEIGGPGSGEKSLKTKTVTLCTVTIFFNGRLNILRSDKNPFFVSLEGKRYVNKCNLKYNKIL